VSDRQAAWGGSIHPPIPYLGAWLSCGPRLPPLSTGALHTHTHKRQRTQVRGAGAKEMTPSPDASLWDPSPASPGTGTKPEPCPTHPPLSTISPLPALNPPQDPARWELFLLVVPALLLVLVALPSPKKQIGARKNKVRMQSMIDAQMNPQKDVCHTFIHKPFRYTHAFVLTTTQRPHTPKPGMVVHACNPSYLGGGAWNPIRTRPQKTHLPSYNTEQYNASCYTLGACTRG
jgi:hypothetical protein